jgi:hypothetical protein
VQRKENCTLDDVTRVTLRILQTSKDNLARAQFAMSSFSSSVAASLRLARRRVERPQSANGLIAGKCRGND